MSRRDYQDGETGIPTGEGIGLPSGADDWGGTGRSDVLLCGLAPARSGHCLSRGTGRR